MTETKGQMHFWSESKLERTRPDLSITSDDGGRFVLTLEKYPAMDNDVFIKMEDTVTDDQFTYINTLRLRSYAGGGFNPFITEEFGSIFDYRYGRILAPLPLKTYEQERINSNSLISVKEFSSENIRLEIKNIGDDDGKRIFMDIIVLTNGDVRLEMKEFDEYELDEVRARGAMLFKTEEHGGKNPYINEALTKLAEKIARARISK